MKKFCVLEQGKLVRDEMVEYHSGLFNTEVSDFYRLNWKTHDDPDAFITAPGACWSEGRSLLYKHVPKNYEYYIFIDDDITWKEEENLAKNISDILTKWSPVAGCFPEFGAWHMQMRPKPVGEVSCVAGFDLNNHIFSASAAQVLFPAVYHGSGRSFWHAQFIVHKVCPEKHLAIDCLPISNSRNLGAAQDTIEAREGKRPYFVMGPQMNIKYSENLTNKEFMRWDHNFIKEQNLWASKNFSPNSGEFVFDENALQSIYDTTCTDYVTRKALRAQIEYKVHG